MKIISILYTPIVRIDESLRLDADVPAALCLTTEDDRSSRARADATEETMLVSSLSPTGLICSLDCV